ncbi:hypothetical protein AB1Y20_011205 [Prymnesium parvum]|uniref:Phytanoyl-CoA dioxygenase family protein n=1 Tax=Prymnesium parvum TaxID=97485 RepID=A0AB34IPF1_PRYPA
MRGAALRTAAARRALSTGRTVGHSGHLSAEALRNQHDAPAVPASSSLSHKQKYLFDLNGFLVLRNVLTDAELGAANAAIDAHLATELHERTGPLRTSALYGRESRELAGDGATGRFDMGGMLAWAEPHREPFREFLCHPRVAPALIELLGVGYRLDHSPLMIAMQRGSEGHTLHGGAVTEAGEPAWPLSYEFRHGQMRSQLLTVCMQLADADEGDGGFCVVPGSHKANFAVPPALADLADPELNEFLRQPRVLAGDVLLFTEAVLHGTLPWRAAHQRRTVIYRFAPAGSAYGRGYSPQWPPKTLEGMTEAQQAVMQPPFHPRMNRPLVGRDGKACQPRERARFKIEFDERVFGSRFF